MNTCTFLFYYCKILVVVSVVLRMFVAHLAHLGIAVVEG